MPRPLNDRAIECLAHATSMERLADQTSDLGSKADLLDTARRWRRLAESYRFLERVERSLADIKTIAGTPDTQTPSARGGGEAEIAAVGGGTPSYGA